MDITVFLGAPGSGKGTQAKRLIEKGEFRHFSTGDMLRAAIQAETEVGKRAKEFMDRGELVPDSTMIELIEGALRDLPASTRAILDGFPRTAPQAEALEQKEFTSVDRAIYFSVPREKLIRRLTGRRVCRKCGQPYHVEFFPPKKEGVCDRCGGEVVQRSDDQKDVVVKRLDVYESQTAPLLDYYRNVGKLRELDADQPVEVLEQQLRELFD